MAKTVAGLCVLILLVIFVYGQQTSRYDSLDLDRVLSNERVLSNYIKCLLSKGPCTPEGRQLREDIPKALVNKCADCSESQRKMVRKAAKYVQQNRPQDWELISKRFDPAGQYRDSFRQFLQASN